MEGNSTSTALPVLPAGATAPPANSTPVPINLKPATQTSSLETTTANDSELAINGGTANTNNSGRDITGLAPTSLDAATQSQDKDSDHSVLLSDSDVKAASNPGAPAEPTGVAPAVSVGPANNIAEQMEFLTGEIQALHNKIDQFTQSLPTKEAPLTHSPETSIPVSGSTASASPADSRPVNINKGTPNPAPVVDLYNNVTEQQKRADKEFEKIKTNEAIETKEDRSVPGTIGTVLIVLGLLAQVAVGAAPLLKDMIPAEVWPLVGSVGYLTAISSLAIGLMFTFFAPGRKLLKILGIIVLVLSIVVYLGVLGLASYLGPLSSVLTTAANFYK